MTIVPVVLVVMILGAVRRSIETLLGDLTALRDLTALTEQKISKFFLIAIIVLSPYAIRSYGKVPKPAQTMLQKSTKLT